MTRLPGGDSTNHLAQATSPPLRRSPSTTPRLRVGSVDVLAKILQPRLRERRKARGDRVLIAHAQGSVLVLIERGHPIVPRHHLLRPPLFTRTRLHIVPRIVCHYVRRARARHGPALVILREPLVGGRRATVAGRLNLVSVEQPLPFLLLLGSQRRRLTGWRRRLYLHLRDAARPTLLLLSCGARGCLLLACGCLLLACRLLLCHACRLLLLR
mmetsp:Transcript_81389/g.161868  ORF Transcript_81389/g.161868 Transcript_81389/m.161868 type:complete len:213 (-) Transcript_81389:445-1083(-)